MKLKMIQTLSTVDALYVGGRTYDLPDATAAAWIAGGLAVEILDAVK